MLNECLQCTTWFAHDLLSCPNCGQPTDSAPIKPAKRSAEVVTGE